jgi:hypothetical protein
MVLNVDRISVTVDLCAIGLCQYISQGQTLKQKLAVTKTEVGRKKLDRRLFMFVAAMREVVC